MFRYIFLASVLFSCFLEAAENLPDKYCVVYGEEEAPIEIVEYFSFSCPQCISCFTKEFDLIKNDFIDSGKVRWVFHPMPMDLSTIQAMHCFSFLDNEQKKIFLEATLPEMNGTKLEVATALMNRAMEFFEKSVDLSDMDALGQTSSFKDAFKYVNQDQVVDAVPELEVNGVNLKQIPTLSTVKAICKSRGIS